MRHQECGGKDAYMKKPRTKIKKKTVIAIVAGAVILAAAIPTVLWSSFQKKKTVVSPNQTAVAEIGDISSTVAGTGSLSMTNTVDMEVPTGIKVTEVLVKEGDVVTAGQILARLDASSVAGKLVDAQNQVESIQERLNDEEAELTALEVENLQGQMKDWQERVGRLEALHSVPEIRAVTDGVIQRVNVEAGEVSSAAAASENTGYGSMGNTGTMDFSGLVSSAAERNTSVQNVSATGSADMVYMTTAYRQDTGYGMENMTYQAKPSMIQMVDTEPVPLTENDAENNAENNANSGDTDENGTDSGTGGDSQNGNKKAINDFDQLNVNRPVRGEVPQNTIQETPYYTGVIDWDPKAEKFQSGTIYTATITLWAKEGYEFTEEAKKPYLRWATCEYYYSNDGSTLDIRARYPATSRPSSEEKDDSLESWLNGGSGLSGSGSDMAAFVIQELNYATVKVDVDEMDILSIQVGQKAKVLLDAVSSEEFEGVISKIAFSATTGNGNAKYAVEITLPADRQRMKEGMSASVTIETGNAEGIVMIPVNALQEQGTRVFVYTSEDETGALSGEKEVKTGVSDSKNVQITEGLKKGDKVYYLKSDNVNMYQKMMEEMYSQSEDGEEMQ